MKLRNLLVALAAFAALAPSLQAHPLITGLPPKASGETLLLIPSRGAALIIIENGSRFDPYVQRLLAEGEMRRWLVVDQPLISIPFTANDAFWNDRPVRQLDEMLRR